MLALIITRADRAEEKSSERTEDQEIVDVEPGWEMAGRPNCFESNYENK